MFGLTFRVLKSSVKARLYPAACVGGVGWPDGWTPIPDNVIVVGEFAALLVTTTLPVTLPAAAGANVTFAVAVCPGFSATPAERPLAVKPPPETVIFEIVTVELPVFVSVVLWLLLLFTLTLAKVKAEVLEISCPETALTLRLAVLLVTLPAELLTVTLNCDPLSELVVAGVVYVEEVAPAIGCPLF